VRAPSTAALLLILSSCGPPHAKQFVGPDGSREWWAVECRGDQAACLHQASEACRGSFEAHEVRSRAGAAEALALSVHDAVIPPLPPGATIDGKTLVVTCAAPTIPPRSVAGPECASSPPRPNHCDVAAGITFTTGRTYLPGNVVGTVVAPLDGLTPESALAELRVIADGLDAEVDAVAAPILAVDAVVKALRDFPRTYRVKPAQVKALAKATLAGRTVTLPPDLRPEVAEELSGLLVHLKAADTAVSATPDRAAALLAKISTRHARVKVLAAAATAPWDAKLRDPGTSAAEKATADANIAEVQELQVDARKKLDVVRTHVTDLSSQIMQALAKLGDATS